MVHVSFARNGYDVTAFDISDAGIEKTKKLANMTGVDVKVFKADILDYRLSANFDILYSSGVLHYIKPEYRQDIFDNYKCSTPIYFYPAQRKTGKLKLHMHLPTRPNNVAKPGT